MYYFYCHHHYNNNALLTNFMLSPTSNTNNSYYDCYRVYTQCMSSSTPAIKIMILKPFGFILISRLSLFGRGNSEGRDTEDIHFYLISVGYGFS